MVVYCFEQFKAIQGNMAQVCKSVLANCAGYNSLWESIETVFDLAKLNVLKEGVKVSNGVSFAVVDTQKNEVVAMVVCDAIPRQEVADLTKAHVDIQDAVRYAKNISRAGAKSPENQAMHVFGYRSPQGNPAAIFGRYVHDKKSVIKDVEAMAERIAGLEYMHVALYFPTHCAKMLQLAGNEGCPFLLNGTCWTSKSLTLNYESFMHTDKDGGWSWILWYDYTPMDKIRKFVPGEFFLTDKLSFVPQSGTLMFLDTPNVPHCSKPPVALEFASTCPMYERPLLGRYGTALFIKPSVLTSGTEHYKQFVSHLQEKKASKRYALTR
jgi:hypothetical protein